MSESEDRYVIIPAPISSPRVLVAKDPTRPNNLTDMIPMVYSFEEWFEAVVLGAPKWLDGATPAIIAATLEMQMKLASKFEGKKEKERVRVTKDEHDFCVPLMKDKERMISGPLGPKTHKFIYAWMSAQLVEHATETKASHKINGHSRKQLSEAK